MKIIQELLHIIAIVSAFITILLSLKGNINLIFIFGGIAFIAYSILEEFEPGRYKTISFLLILYLVTLALKK